MDEGDADAASFFYYMGRAAQRLAPRRKLLPLLLPEYLAGLSTFARNYFRELYARLRHPGIVVLDNYQEAPDDSLLHELLSVGLCEIPEGMNVVILSRTDPPAGLARLLTHEHIALLNWDELRLTPEESMGIAKLHQGNAPRALVHALLEQTQGWVAGLVLLLEQSRTSQGTPLPQTRSDLSGVFDYFADEIFRHSSPALQELLLRTAFLPKITVADAERLTGNSHAARLLQDLTHRNYFTVRHADGSYEYHPLFRDFLSSRVTAEYAPQALHHLKTQSAQLLAKSGETQSAVALLEQAQDWTAAAELILQQAAALAGQGRTQTLAAWLSNIPAALREQQPWILYWLGVCDLSVNPAQARACFERAYALFEAGTDSVPLYLAWCGIIDSFLLEWNVFTPMDKWLDTFRALRRDRPAPPVEIEAASIFRYVGGLFYRRPADSDLAAYARKAAALFFGEADLNRRFIQSVPLILYYTWTGEIATTRRILDTLSPHARNTDLSPLGRLHWHSWKTFLTWITGSPDECLREVTDGLALADASGVHVLDPQMLGQCIYGHLRLGNVAAARAAAQRMASLLGRAKFYDGFYTHLVSMISLHAGHAARAAEEGSQSVQFARAAGGYFGEAISLLTLAAASCKLGHAERALQEIEAARVIGRLMNSKVVLYWCGFTEAGVRLLAGDPTQALGALSDALALGADIDAVTPPWCLLDDAALLYQRALEAGLQRDYVRKVIGKTKLSPPPGLASEHWPWPVRIYTLGRFAVLVDDRSLSFSTKAQKKPMELLKALIALGGREVRETRLTEALWPDAEADAAAFALTTTVHRLRKLIGEAAIERQQGCLTLNPRYCWVDTWALERQLAGIESACLEQKLEEVVDAGDRLEKFYSGAFLNDHPDEPWVLSARERLRGKLLRALDAAATVLARAQRHEQAARCLEQGLQADPLAESFYRKLMQAQLAQGNRAEALSVYQRCRRMLAAHLKLAPSPETEKIVEGIR